MRVLKSPTVFVPEEGPAASAAGANLQTVPASSRPRSLHSSSSVYLPGGSGQGHHMRSNSGRLPGGSVRVQKSSLRVWQAPRHTDPLSLLQLPQRSPPRRGPAASISGANLQTVLASSRPSSLRCSRKICLPGGSGQVQYMSGLGQSLRYHVGGALGSLRDCSSVEDFWTVKLP